jgi:hypothetical protein
MSRRVFFSFHYQRDIFRVNQIRGLPNIIGDAAAGFTDASLWEATKRQGDAAIKRLIDNGLLGTSVTVVCIGAASAERKYIDYEIEQSINRGNGILGLRINHLTGHDRRPDVSGAVPSRLLAHGAPIYTYSDGSALAEWIERAAKAAGR